MLAVVLAAILEVRPSTTPIRVDARLDEPAWAAATAVPVAYEWYPSDNTAAPVDTEALVTYDERNLYVAFRARDPSASSRSRRTRSTATPRGSATATTTARGHGAATMRRAHRNSAPTAGS